MSKKMNPEVKQLWVEALRSGNYLKGVGSLYHGDMGKETFCALGVLCEEAAKRGITTIDSDAMSHGRFVNVDPGRLVPDEVADWAQLGDFADIELEVMRKNDHTKASFKDVADFIEREF